MIKYAKVCTVFTLLLMLVIVIAPIADGTSTINAEKTDTYEISQTPTSAYIPDVPYVWQEVNGYCFSAALSMVLQTMGIDLNLHDLMAVMGTGFSSMYVANEGVRMFFPGVFVRQPNYIQFFCDLYGLDLTTYCDTREAFGYGGAMIYDGLGLDYVDFANASIELPLGVVRDSISSGIPLTIAADIYYLPPHDYDDSRLYGSPLSTGGAAHAITIVGFNDTSQEVYIQDPGVGLWEDDYGYPDDGRWNYTMSYSSFDRAWRSAGYFTFRIKPGSGPVEDFNERLGEYLCKKLRGDRTLYFKGYENYFYLSPGKTAYSGMALDLNVETISDYAKYFREVDKPEAFVMLGHLFEIFLTIQYHGFLNALESITKIFPEVDLTEFVDSAGNSLSHFEPLCSNESIRATVNVVSRDTLIFSTFDEIAEDFQLSGDLDGSIAQHQEQLNEIRNHLFEIAKSWEAAALALEEALNLPPPSINEGSILVVVGGAGLILVALACILVRRRK